MNFNRVVIGGHLTRDVKLETLPSGTSVADFGIACNERWKDANGEQKERVCFVDVRAFAGRADTVAKYFAKGDPILVEGKLRFDQWEAQDGGKRSKLYVIMDSFSFCESKKDRGGGGGVGQDETPPATDDDLSIPF